MSAYLDRKSAGLCVICGENPPISGKTRCTDCTQKVNKRKRAKWLKRVKSDSCLWCGEPAVNGRYCPKHQEAIRVNEKERLKNIKIEVFKAYGGCKCTRCGETELWVLCLDHIDGGGTAHRKQVRDESKKFYSHLKKLGFPDKDKYRILCANCNIYTHIMKNRIVP